VFAALLAPYIVFCIATTGRPLPNTYYAKTWAWTRMDPQLGHWRATYLPQMYGVAREDNWAFAVLLIPGLATWALRRLRGGSGLVLGWPLAFWAYAIVSMPRHFSLSRYTIPLVPFMALLSMDALAGLLERIRGRAARLGVAALSAALIVAGGWRSQLEYRPL